MSDKCRSADQYMVVGSRIFRLLFNEDQLRSPDLGAEEDEELEAKLSASLAEPRVVEAALDGRDVIEQDLTVTYQFRCAKKKSSKQVLVFALMATTGFVGMDPADDGDLDAFESCAESCGRLGYLQHRAIIKALWDHSILGLSGHLPPYDLPVDKFEHSINKKVTKKAGVRRPSASKALKGAKVTKSAGK